MPATRIVGRMSMYQIAHLREQGQDMIIVPLESNFGRQTEADQERTVAYLQRCAASAGLAGTVVPVWDAGGGRMAIRAPRSWHAFFSSTNLQVVAANLNKTLTCP